MNIGEAAKETGLSSKMIRHYEDIGLLKPARRTDAGYRAYSAEDLRTLHFVRHARDLGFSLAKIAQLVSLWTNPRRASADVKRIALAHVSDLERQIALMTGLRDALVHAAGQCHGDQRPECPILEGMEQTGPGARAKPAAKAAPRARH